LPTFALSHTRDILQNFPLSDIAADVGKLLMAAHISLAYPVTLYPGTKSVQFLLSLLPYRRFEELQEQKWWSWVSHWVITFFVLTLTAGLAILLPNIQIVFGLIGSTGSVFLNLVVPSLMLFYSPLSLYADERLSFSVYEGSERLKVPDHGKYPALRERVTAVAIIVLGVAIAICGTGTNIYENFFAESS